MYHTRIEFAKRTKGLVKFLDWTAVTLAWIAGSFAKPPTVNAIEFSQ